MTLSEAQERHQQLVEEIRRHDHAYYVLAQETLTDPEYDRLYQELVDLETNFSGLVTPESPTQRVGGQPVGGFQRVKHLVPMLSLEKIEASKYPTEKEEPDLAVRNRLQDQSTLNGLKSFDKTIQKHLKKGLVDYVMEPKVDGVSIAVHYKNGKLALGVTRGDGIFGDDITANVRTIRGIPLELNLRNPPPLIEIRGEAYISKIEFEELNAKLTAAGEQPFPNARNATAGTLKQLDPHLVSQRPLSVVFYAVGACEGIHFSTHAEVLESLKEFGLPTQSLWWLCKGVDQVLEHYNEEVVCGYNENKDLRSKVPYDIDGIVLKVNSLDDWKHIPAKSRAPGYAIVHKPVPWITPAETLLKAITVQVGRTGVLTPVAELQPIFVQGSTISRATLHNEDEIRRKDIRIGDTVVIRKAGMVIPEVRGVVMLKRPSGTKEFDLFAHVQGKCPACGGAIIKEKVSNGDKEEVAWRCQNIAGCPAQKTRRLEYFAERKALDIESLGGIVAEKLVESELVDEPLDLFTLDPQKLAKLNLGTETEPRLFGEKNAAKLLAAVERARTAPLARWLHALAIPEIGQETAYDLAKYYQDLPSLAGSSLLRDTAELGRVCRKFEENKVGKKEGPTLSKNEIVRRREQQKEAKLAGNPIGRRLIEAGFAKPDGNSRANDWRAHALIGPAAASSIVNWLESELGRTVLRRILQLGLSPLGEALHQKEASDPAKRRFDGKTFVITGTLAAISREDARERIRQLGGEVTGAVSKNTDFLVVGLEAGSKLAKAKAMGVKTLTEEEFLKMAEWSGEAGPPNSQSTLL